MSSHISDDLPGLLAGDASRDTVMAAAEHLRTCPDCQQDLVSAVVAHAALTSAQRFAPEIVTGDAEDETAEEPAPAPTPLPDLSPVFAQAHSDAARPAPRAHKRRQLLAVAAVAAVIVGGGATIAAVTLGSSSPQTQSVALTPFPTGNAPSRDAHAKVTIDNGKLHVDASTLPKLDGGHVYELWLTDDARASMQSVGTFDNGKVDLHVDPRVMSRYSDFEVSVQRPNQIGYSHTSVVRGQYS